MLLDPTDLYDKYNIQLRVIDRLDGGTPADPELVKKWVAAKTGFDDEQTLKQIEQAMPDIEAAADEQGEKVLNTFKVDADSGRPYIEARQINAMFREAAKMLGITKKKIGSKQILQHGMEFRGENGGPKIYLNIQNPGRDERAIHVMTAQGPRSAIKRVDFAGPNSTLEFQVWILTTSPNEKRHLGLKEMTQMLTFAQQNGLGANRSQGSGKFEVMALDKLDEPT